jgi:hypothetical protein
MSMVRRGLAGLASCIVGLAINGLARAETPVDYAETLVKQAAERRLADSTTWRRLLHYRKGWFGWESEADGDAFFLAKEGKTEPQDELSATLRGLFEPESKDPKLQHPLCRFPARVAWLDQQLRFDWSKIPVRDCPRYREFLELLRPSGISLVFSSYYLNNPSSALGHTFLRVHRAKDGRRESPDLLDYGVDFSATVDTHNAFIYAVKGLTGLFPGQFKRVPYYYKVREYNDHDSRDLWEYELNLTPQQVALVAAHLWELGSTYFSYYYLSENCSYHVLGALEVADPELHLLKQIGWPTVPVDTIKALDAHPGLVKRVQYRPSIRTQFKRRLERLDPEQRDLVMALMRDPRTPIPAHLSQADRVRVLDTTIDLVDIGFAGELLKERKDMDPKMTAMQQILLERRAEDLVPSEESKEEPPWRQMPNVGHDTKRVGMSSGYRMDHGYFHALSFRLALHDLADANPGYLDSAQIEFFSGNLRYYVENPRLRLEDLSLVRVRSLSPVTRFERSLSWALDVGMRRIHDRGCSDCATGFATVAGGYTLEPFGSFLDVYALAKIAVEMPAGSGALGDFVRVGVGPWGGLRFRFTDQIAWLTLGSWSYLPGQTPWRTWRVESALRAGYRRNLAAGIEARIQPEERMLQATSYFYF